MSLDSGINHHWIFHVTFSWIKIFHNICGGETICDIAIILNLYSTTSHPNYKTHEKIFINKKSLATKLHIFCLTIFSHQHPPNRNNLDNHVNKCILLSYDDHVKGYHCYQPFKCHVIISHYVQIIEDAHVNLDKNFPIVCTNLIVSYFSIFPNLDPKLLKLIAPPLLRQVTTSPS
jgi:hypothetical protein